MLIVQTALFVAVCTLCFLPLMGAEIAALFSPLNFLALPLFLLSTLLFILTVVSFGRKFRGKCKGHSALSTLLTFLTFLVSLFVIRPYLPLPSLHSAENQPLTVVSWNCDNLRLSEDTLQKAAAFIKSQHPDIICLQERPHDNLLHRYKIIQAFREYPYRLMNGREDEVLNLAVFSKYPLSRSAVHYFHDSYNKYLTVDVNISRKQGMSQPITLFVAHLQTTGITDLPAHPTVAQLLKQYIRNTQRRNQQADFVRADMDKRSTPLVLAGDFNAIRSSYTYRILSAGLHDAARSNGFGGGSFQRFHNLLKIDYILSSSPLTPRSYHLYANTWSDHKIQVATFDCSIVPFLQE